MNLYWIWLTTIKGVGAVTAKKLISKFKTPDKIFNASKEELDSVKGLTENIKNKIINSKSLEETKIILNRCNKLDIKLLTYDDILYPEYAKKLPKSPVLLYYRGNIINNSIGVGIVGCRRCTQYGKKVAVEAAEFLAENNIPVISGMAKGIDGYAHTACIKSNGYTLAILGCGTDICYPKEHIKLMQKIIENGAVISEYPPGTKPEARNFPERNRLISAFSRKLLVVEASYKSGALITADFSKKYNKDVLAVPNNIYCKESFGTNKLIAEGAEIYLNPEQLLINCSNNQHIKKEKNHIQNYNNINLSPLEFEIINKVKEKSISIDELLILLKKDKDIILETLSMMELEGTIKIISGKLLLR